MAILTRTDPFYDVREWAYHLSILERQTCIIETESGQPLTTGFLVGPGIVMSAAHGLRGRNENPTDEIRARFDFTRDPISLEVHHGRTVDLAETDALLGFAPHDPENNLRESVDTMVLRLADEIGNETENPRGWVRLKPDSNHLKRGDGLAIIGHPRGGPLKMSINTQSVIGYDDLTGQLLYRTNTMPGLSGAPCFDLNWNFAAMHQGKAVQQGNYNFGIPTSLIVDWLQTIGIWEQVSKEPPKDVSMTGASSTNLHSPEPEKSFGLPLYLEQLMNEDKEGQLIEYKVSWVNAKKNCLRTLAAFMNSKKGGTMLLGIADDGEVVGIENEYKDVNSQKANWDGFSLALIDSFVKLDSSGNVHDFIDVQRYKEDSKDICVVAVQPSDRPVFLNNKFFQRVGNQTRLIQGHEMLHFVARRWSWLGLTD